MKLLLSAFLLVLCLSANAQQKFTVYFDTDSAEANAKQSGRLAEWLAQNTGIDNIKIYGYTDKSGTAAYNKDLSERRANYIYGQLKAANIGNNNSMVIKGFGESRAKTANSKKDRKVEIYYGESNLIQQFKRAKTGDKVLLKNLYFVGGTAYVVKESMPVFKELYTIMRDNPKLKIDIQGHICCDVDDLDNLGEKRAAEIYLYLENSGIDAKRMSVHGFGGHKPIHSIPEKSKEEMEGNRRVEIEILEN